MKKISEIFIVSLTIGLIILSLTGCSIKNEEENKSKNKTTSEIDYVEDSIIKIINKYAKGEYLKDDVLEWKNILEDEKILMDSVDTIVLDLSEIDIKDEDIIKLSNEINNLIIATKDNDEVKLISKLKDIYLLIPEYLKAIEKDENIINKKRVTSLIISTYDFVNQDRWEDAKKEVVNLENKYKEMMNNLKYAEENSYNLNNIYVLIEEYKNAINLENKELINLKLVNLLEKI